MLDYILVLAIGRANLASVLGPSPTQTGFRVRLNLIQSTNRSRVHLDQWQTCFIRVMALVSIFTPQKVRVGRARS